MVLQVLREGIPEEALEADQAWKPAVPVTEMCKMQL